jgi:hypothetical protein
MNRDFTLVHLCLVSERPLANLIPVLQYRPGYVALGVTATMRDQAEAIQRLLASLGYTPEQIVRFEVPEGDIETIREAALTIETELQARYPGCRIAYNATGGTKLMALGFAELLSGGDNTVFYTDTQRDRIEFVHPRERASESIRSVLNIEGYLRAHGKRLRRAASDDLHWRERAKARKPLSKWLAGEAEALNQFFGSLNRLAQQALDQNQSRGQPPRIAEAEQRFPGQPPHGLWAKALAKMDEHGCCRWDASRSL